MIYADNAATTRMSDAAMAAMLPYLNRIYGNPSSPHCAGRQAAEAVWHARETVAGVLGCAPREILFTSGGSEADNQAILTAAAVGERTGRKHIVASAIEHHAILRPLEALKRRGFEVTLLGVPEDGIVRPEAFAAALRPDTVLATVMYANNEIGTVQPAARLGALCRERGVLFHTDAVQAAGHLDIDVCRDRIDMLSLSAHKFRGPKGAGALMVRQGIPVSRLIEGGGQERGSRAGTENVPAIVGMAAALREAARHREENAAKLVSMRDFLIRGLTAIPGTVLNGDPERRLPGLVSVCFEGVESEALLLLLDDAGICASAGAACASGALMPSHVLRAIGRTETLARGALRLSLSEENTMEEAEAILRAVKAAVSRLRG